MVAKIAARAKTAGLTWEIAETLDETALEERLYGRPAAPGNDRARPDPVYMHQELRRVGVTLELLHLEYLEEHPDGLRYTAFCDCYRKWHARAGVVMRQVHKAGEKTFVDYSGKKPSYIDPETGEVIEVEFFVAVLGASNYTFAEATETQQVVDFVGSHVRAYAYFGGVTEITVPDQLKSGVTTPGRYELGVQRTYGEMARHYGTAIVPARPCKPRDKAKVEVGVQIAQRWILARLRNEQFFSLHALNARIAELCEELNARPMKKLGGATRRDLYERYDRPAMQPLPATAYEITEWKQVRVNLDYPRGGRQALVLGAVRPRARGALGVLDGSRWCSSFIAAIAWPCTRAVACLTSTRPTARTCPKRIACTLQVSTAYSRGRQPSDLGPKPWCVDSSRRTRYASKGGDPREAFDALRRSTVPSEPSELALARSSSVRVRTNPSPTSSRSAASSFRCPARSLSRLRPSLTRTSVGPGYYPINERRSE